MLSAVLLGMIWPGIVQAFQVRPTEPDKEAPYIANNIAATRMAYDIQDVDVTAYTGTGVGADDQATCSTDTASVPLVDPQLVHQAFEQIQQVRSYYSVADVLDVDRYDIDGTDRALVLGVRELDQSGMPDDARNWSNLHTVYTHGNGIIAAFANQRPADDGAEGTEIQWAEGQQADQNALSEATGGYESRVYYGEESPDYSIVGKRPGAVTSSSTSVGRPAAASRRRTTARAGSRSAAPFRKLLYAVKFGDPNFLLSERVNENSKVLYIRNPRERVQKVAPWLTVDSDAYPAVVDGRILWVVDGYTTTDRYPLAEKESIQTMTDDSLTQANNLPIVPTDQINYMRNAVKATVDAYDGTVRLYALGHRGPDAGARGATPSPARCSTSDQMPPELVSHLRYPEDLFKVQRYQFARYHVTDPATFYQKNAWWEVPDRPRASGQAPAAVPAVRAGPGDRRTTSSRSPRSTCRTTRTTWRRSSRSTPTRPTRRRTAACGCSSCPTRTRRARQHRQRDAVRPRGHARLLPLTQGGASRVTLRQPADPAGDRRADVRAADLRHATALRRQLPDPALRHGLVRRQGRHRRDARGGDHRRPRRRRRRRRLRTAADNPPDDGGGGTVPAQVRNLLAQAEDDFEAADRAFAEGKVGQWATLHRGGARRRSTRPSSSSTSRTRRGAASGSQDQPTAPTTRIWAASARGVTVGSPTRGGAAR